MMPRGFDLNMIRYEDVKAQHEELLRQLLTAQQHVSGEAEKRRRFFRMYWLRSVLFRVMPRLAARLAR